MNRFRSFMRDKGFYIALLACILAAALSSFFAIRSMLHRISEDGPNEARQEEIPWQAPQVEAEQKTPGIPVQPGPSAKPSPRPSASAGQPSQRPAPQPSPAPAGPAAASSVQPVSGPICAGYSGDELVFSETLRDWRTHTGGDIACAGDAAVKACRAGTVTAVYEDGLWGQVVEIESEGVVFRYAGLDPAVRVKAGEQVSAGQQLGVIGTVPCEGAAGPHLHLETLRGGVLTDPMEFLR